MLHNRSTGFWIAISFFGMMTGTVMGEAIAAILPESSTALRSFFGGALEFSVGPLGFDLVVFRIFASPSTSTTGEMLSYISEFEVKILSLIDFRHFPLGTGPSYTPFHGDLPYRMRLFHDLSSIFLPGKRDHKRALWLGFRSRIPYKNVHKHMLFEK